MQTQNIQKAGTTVKKRFHPRKRLLIAFIVAFLLISCGIILFLSNGRTIDSSWSSVMSTILIILGVLFAFLQWFLPLHPIDLVQKKDIPLPQDSSTNVLSDKYNSLVSQTPTQPISAITKNVTLDDHESSITSLHKAINPVTLLPQVSQPTNLLKDQAPFFNNIKVGGGVINVLQDTVFQCNEPLADQSAFFCRVRESYNLLNRTSRRGSTSIVGARRIGKTWLVDYLKLLAPDKLGPSYRIVYVDATSANCTTPNDFIAMVLEALGIPSVASSGLSVLEKVVKDFVLNNYTPVLCIDGFEGLVKKREFDLNFLASLRAMTHTGLVIIATSQRPLIDIVSEDMKTSPFFNVFEQLTLKDFNKAEAEEFVLKKGKQANLTVQESLYILKYGTVHLPRGEQAWPPLLLQLAGKKLLLDKITAKEHPYHYRPDDPMYWQEFSEELERTYKGAVR